MSGSFLAGPPREAEQGGKEGDLFTDHWTLLSGPRPNNQTSHVPPYPTVTFTPSTMTGTCLLPPVSFSISGSLEASFFTSTYSTLSP